jgi:hypothetical protein
MAKTKTKKDAPATGTEVTFKTAGRYPIEQKGTVLGMNDNGFVRVQVGDKIVKTRPSTLHAG